MVGHRSTLQSRVTVAVGYGGLPPCLDRFQAGRLGYMTKMSLTGLCRVNPACTVCPVKCREVTVKKKRVETFRNIQYPVGRIYYVTDSAATVGPSVGLAQARPNNHSTLLALVVTVCRTKNKLF